MTTVTDGPVPATTEFLRQQLRPRPRTGEVALITGGTQGIGKEVARALVRAGVTTVIAARGAETGGAAATELSAQAAPDARAVFQPVDLADAGSIAGLAEFVSGEFGRLDILVNDAARAFPPQSAFTVTADQMRAVFEVNVFAVVTLTNALMPLLEAAEAGRIVNVSTERGSLGVGETPVADDMRRRAGNTAPAGTMAHRIAFVTPPNMTYGSSKAALNAVTQHFAHQLEQTGSRVRINAAAPGHCATPFNNFRGWRTAGEGARIITALALCGDDAPQGGFFNDQGPTVL